MESRRPGKGPPRPSSPVSFWPGHTQITPPQPVQRPPPPVSRRPPPADGASVRTGSSHGSSTIKASRAHFGLFGFVTRSKDKSNSDGGSTITPKPPNHGRSPFDILSRGKSKAASEPAPPLDPDERSEAARYLESKRAAVMPPPHHDEPLHVTSSRALDDLMSPLALQRSHDSSSAFVARSAGSESPVKSVDDDQFLKELEAGVTPSDDVPVWLSGSLGSNVSASVPRSHKNRSRRQSKEIHRTSSNGSLGSGCGDDESYSNDDGSSEDDIRRRSGESRRNSYPNISPTTQPRGLPMQQRYGPRTPPGMPVTRENFRPPVPAPVGMPPDPFGHTNPFGSDSPALFQMDSISPVDPIGILHPTLPNYLYAGPLDTIHSDSEHDGTSIVAKPPRPAHRSKTSPPSQSLPSERREKIEQARASAGFSRRPGRKR